MPIYGRENTALLEYFRDGFADWIKISVEWSRNKAGAVGI